MLSGNMRRQLLGGVVELAERGIDGGLIVGLFALDHRRQTRPAFLPLAFIVAWVCLTTILLRHDCADAEQQRSRDHDNTRFIRSLPL